MQERRDFRIVMRPMASRLLLESGGHVNVRAKVGRESNAPPCSISWGIVILRLLRTFPCRLEGAVVSLPKITKV